MKRPMSKCLKNMYGQTATVYIAKAIVPSIPTLQLYEDMLDLLGPILTKLSTYLGRAPYNLPGLLPKLDEAYFQRVDRPNVPQAARLGEVLREAAHGVAAHLGDRAVRVRDVHRGRGAGRPRRQDGDDAVRPDAAAAIADPPGALGPDRRPLHEDEVVPEAVPLGEPERQGTAS